jgi:Tfp pilus assembly protein PilO
MEFEYFDVAYLQGKSLKHVKLLLCLFLSLIITLLHVSFTVSFTDEDDTLTEHETKVKKPKSASASKYLKSSSLD